MNQDFNKKINEFVSLIEPAEKIAIIAHQSPDGDATGSILALKLFLEKLGKEVSAILPDKLPEFLTWLPQAQTIITTTEAGKKAIEESDLIICADFNESKRVGELADILERSSAAKILIDHHQEPKVKSVLSFSYPNEASTAEIVFKILYNIDKNLVDKQIATCIFTGILTDTGCFCHDSVASSTFETAAQLMEYNINKQYIINRLFHNYSYDRMRLMGYILQNKLTLTGSGKLAYAILERKEQEQFNYKKGDHENFVNLALSINTVEVSLFIMETDEKIKISLRSKGQTNVNEIAKKYFDGGGHKKAAGGSWKKSITELVQLIETKIVKELNF